MTVKLENILTVVNAVFLAVAVVLWAVARNVFSVPGLNLDPTTIGNVLRWLTLALFALTVVLVAYLAVAGGAERSSRIGKAIISLVLLLSAFTFVAGL